MHVALHGAVGGAYSGFFCVCCMLWFFGWGLSPPSHLQQYSASPDAWDEEGGTCCYLFENKFSQNLNSMKLAVIQDKVTNLLQYQILTEKSKRMFCSNSWD